MFSVRLEGWRERTKCSCYEQWSVDYCGARRSRIVGITTNSSTWKQEAATHQFSCSGEQSSNDTVVWKGLLPVFGYSWRILPDTTWWKRWMGRNHIFYVVNTQFHELSENPKSGLLSSWSSLQYEIQWTHLSLWYPERLNASCTSFINSKESSGPVMNCS